MLTVWPFSADAQLDGASGKRLYFTLTTSSFADAQLFISNESAWITAVAWPEPGGGGGRRPALLLGRADGRLVLVTARRHGPPDSSSQRADVQYGRTELEHCGSDNGEAQREADSLSPR